MMAIIKDIIFITEFYKTKYKNVVENPKVIDEDKELFILSAMWFWEANDLM